MKKLTFIILPILVISVFAWKNQRTIASLQAQLQERSRTPVASLSSSGVINHTSSTSAASRVPDTTSAEYVMQRLLTYAEQKSERLDDPKKQQQRTLEETEWVLALDGKQLKILITELQNESRLSADVRDDIIRFALHILTKSHPRDVCVFLQKHPQFDSSQDSWPPRGLSIDALSAWAALEPSAAMAWLDEIKVNTSEMQRDSLERALLDGAIQSDPYLAIERLKQNEQVISTLMHLIEHNKLKTDKRLAVIHAWREHGGLELRSEGDFFDTVSLVRTFIFGGLDMRPSAFMKTTQLIDAAALSDKEIAQLATCCLGSEIIPAEAEQWLDWLEANTWPKQYSKRWQSTLMLSSDPLPYVGKWWLKRKDDPRRKAMLETCCNTIFGSARLEWIKVVKALPPGDERLSLLKSIRNGWRTDSPEEEAALQKFLSENGLK